MTLNRPDKLNALSDALMEEIVQALGETNRDDEVKALIITGAGRGFCSGADLTQAEKAEMTRRLLLEPVGFFSRIGRSLHDVEKPVVAAVNGIAAGAGFSIALGCDIRIAAQSARFSAIFIRRALAPDTGASYLLPRIVGIAKALELMWTGDIIDAREAERIGLVSWVVPDEDLMKVARELAGRITSMPSVAIELTKRMVYKGLDVSDFAVSQSYEGLAVSITTQTEDFQEGIKSFLEKREPEFKGR